MVEMQGEFQNTFRPVGELPQRHPDPAGMITANSKTQSKKTSKQFECFLLIAQTLSVM